MGWNEDESVGSGVGQYYGRRMVVSLVKAIDLDVFSFLCRIACVRLILALVLYLGLQKMRERAIDHAQVRLLGDAFDCCFGLRWLPMWLCWLA